MLVLLLILQPCYTVNSVLNSIPEQSEIIKYKLSSKELCNFYIIPHKVGLEKRRKAGNGCISMISNNVLFCHGVQVRTSKP